MHRPVLQRPVPSTAAARWSAGKPQQRQATSWPSWPPWPAARRRCCAASCWPTAEAPPWLWLWAATATRRARAACPPCHGRQLQESRLFGVGLLHRDCAHVRQAHAGAQRHRGVVVAHGVGAGGGVAALHGALAEARGGERLAHAAAHQRLARPRRFRRRRRRHAHAPLVRRAVAHARRRAVSQRRRRQAAAAAPEQLDALGGAQVASGSVIERRGGAASLVHTQRLHALRLPSKQQVCQWLAEQ